MIRKVMVSPFQVNCWIVVCPKTGEAAVIDPGDDAADILHALEEAAEDLGKPLDIKFLLHTHAHLDHFGATRALYEALGAKQSSKPRVALHPKDGELWSQLRSQGRFFSLDFEEPIAVDLELTDGMVLAVGALSLQVLATPGHSPGGVCFLLAAHPELQISETVFSGDTLFQGSIGRTDLWGGDLDTLIKSIKEKLFSLKDGVRVCCGHGPDTQIGIEKKQNPFLHGVL